MDDLKRKLTANLENHIVRGRYDRGHDSSLIQKQIGSATNVRLYYTWLKSKLTGSDCGTVDWMDWTA